MQLYIFLYLLAANALAFTAYGIDKWKAKHEKWRIPERNLILLAVIGGSIGALLGMKLFRHKTKHMKFVIGVPLILILQLIAAVLVIYLMYFRH